MHSNHFLPVFPAALAVTSFHLKWTRRLFLCKTLFFSISSYQCTVKGQHKGHAGEMLLHYISVFKISAINICYDQEKTVKRPALQYLNYVGTKAERNKHITVAASLPSPLPLTIHIQSLSFQFSICIIRCEDGSAALDVSVSWTVYCCYSIYQPTKLNLFIGRES